MTNNSSDIEQEILDQKNNDMNSQDYLDAMNQLQSKFVIFENENKINKHRYRSLCKELCEVFGLVETLGTMFHDAVDAPPEVYMLFECISAKTNRIMDELII